MLKCGARKFRTWAFHIWCRYFVFSHNEIFNKMNLTRLIPILAVVTCELDDYDLFTECPWVETKHDFANMLKQRFKQMTIEFYSEYSTWTKYARSDVRLPCFSAYSNVPTTIPPVWVNASGKTLNAPMVSFFLRTSIQIIWKSWK